MKNSLYLLVLVSLTAAGCATTQRAAVDDSSLEVIDAHIHTEFTGDLEETSKIPMTKEQLLKEFREANVVGAVAHIDESGSTEHNMKEFNVIHCTGVTKKPDLKRIEAGLKTGRYGCIKIYLGYAHQYAYDPLYRPVYRLAEKYGVPVVFHTGDTYTSDGKLKYAHPLTIDEVAVDFRKVNFVIAHMGNPWTRTAAEVAYKNPNVFIEASALIIGDINSYSDEDLERYVVEPIRHAFGYIEDPSKFMFGTDWPLSGIKAYMDVYKRAIPREHWRAVFHDNAARVFKLTNRKRQESDEEVSLPVVR